jgi:hypothetical protein
MNLFQSPDQHRVAEQALVDMRRNVESWTLSRQQATALLAWIDEREAEREELRSAVEALLEEISDIGRMRWQSIFTEDFGARVQGLLDRTARKEAT